MVVAAEDVVVVEDDSVEIHVLVDTVEGVVRSQPTSPKQSKMQPKIEMRIGLFMFDLLVHMNLFYHNKKRIVHVF
jgi:hypothetical protein